MRIPTCSCLLRVASSLGTVLTAALACGCATRALWRSTAAVDWQPALPVSVCRCTTTNPNVAVAVSFTQYRVAGKDRKTRPALCCYSEAATHLLVGDRRIQAYLKTCSRVEFVPVQPPGAPPPAPSAAPVGYAVMDGDANRLTLHVDGVSPGPRALPATREETQIALRIVGLPFAVVADAVVMAVLLAAFGLSGGAAGM